MAKTIELKAWPEYFADVLSEAKTFEARVDDRDFAVGDLLILREWDPATGYTGRKTERRISYILKGGEFGIAKGWAILAIKGEL